MVIKPKLRCRRVAPVLALLVMLGLGRGLAVDPASASPGTLNAGQEASVNAGQEASANWAGYVVDSSAGDSFSSVTGSWTQPAVSPSSGDGYSAFWVGLGGARDQSQALEQVGASSDVVNGQTEYYAWYELLPGPETQLKLAVHPGDHLTGTVTAKGTDMTVSLANQTTGQSMTRTSNMSNPNPDTSSAEWIAEAPSTQTQGGDLQTLPLANFGTVNFTNASATAGGHTGSISDPRWAARRVQLAPTATIDYPGAAGILTLPGLGVGSSQAGGGASPSNLSSDGSSFSVSYTPNAGAAPSSAG
jgi:hypothetical protein